MIELTKISANKVHKLIRLLNKLELYHIREFYKDIDDIYDAWKFAERNIPKEVKSNA